VRVVFANNYSMTKAFADVARGVYPAQHLYGADALARAGWDVAVAPFSARSDELAKRLRYVAGDLGQEAYVVRARRAAYSGEPNSLALLAYLRGLRLRRRPLVTVLHSVPRRTARTALQLRGYDRVICLSSYVRDELLAAFGLDPERVSWAPWGPALDFPGYVPAGEDAVMSSGKTNRDQATLLAALEGLPGVVYARSPRGLSVPDGVELVTDETHADTVEPGGPKFSYGHVLRDLVRASVVAIPLRDPLKISGLSELNDALALGKPVVVTRTPHLRDVDVEAIGCGWWVEPGDVAGWRTALRRLHDDPALRARMGAAGRAFAEERWNAAIFGQRVVEALASVVR
jgi:glycosyltransferase involved in cell wall biosynthesis